MITHARLKSIENKARSKIEARRQEIHKEYLSWLGSVPHNEMDVIQELLYRLYIRLDELGFFSPAPFDWEELPTDEKDKHIRELSEWLGTAARLKSGDAEVDAVLIEVWQTHRAEGHPARATPASAQGPRQTQ